VGQSRVWGHGELDETEARTFFEEETQRGLERSIVVVKESRRRGEYPTDRECPSFAPSIRKGGAGVFGLRGVGQFRARVRDTVLMRSGPVPCLPLPKFSKCVTASDVLGLVAMAGRRGSCQAGLWRRSAKEALEGLSGRAEWRRCEMAADDSRGQRISSRWRDRGFRTRGWKVPARAATRSTFGPESEFSRAKTRSSCCKTDADARTTRLGGPKTDALPRSPNVAGVSISVGHGRSARRGGRRSSRGSFAFVAIQGIADHRGRIARGAEQVSPGRAMSDDSAPRTIAPDSRRPRPAPEPRADAVALKTPPRRQSASAGQPPATEAPKEAADRSPISAAKTDQGGARERATVSVNMVGADSHRQAMTAVVQGAPCVHREPGAQRDRGRFHHTRAEEQRDVHARAAG